MSDNLSLHMAHKREKLVAEITSAGIDAITKVITRSQLSTIDIVNSVLLGMIFNKDEQFSILRSNLTPLIGQGINLCCNLNQGNLKMLRNIKGNHNAFVFDNCEKTYLFTNGNCTTVISKAKPLQLNDLLPISQNTVSQKTDKCKQIASAKGKSKSVDILIYDNRIAMVKLLALNVFMSFNQISTAELIDRKPDLQLRSAFFFHLVADEALLEISFDKGNFWLRTVIQLTEDISIEQFEPLQRIK
jgi:hypothetical protein